MTLTPSEKRYEPWSGMANSFTSNSEDRALIAVPISHRIVRYIISSQSGKIWRKRITQAGNIAQIV
jgi:hypothetical protein